MLTKKLPLGLAGRGAAAGGRSAGQRSAEGQRSARVHLGARERGLELPATGHCSHVSLQLKNAYEVCIPLHIFFKYRASFSITYLLVR